MHAAALGADLMEEDVCTLGGCLSGVEVDGGREYLPSPGTVLSALTDHGGQCRHVPHLRAVF